MAASYLAGTVLMAALLAAVVVVLLRARGWRSYSVATAGGGGAGAGGTLWETYDRMSSVVRNEMVWVIGFLALALLAMASVAVFFAEGPSGAMVLPLLGAVFAVALVGYVVAGIYRMLRNRGRPRSEAIAVVAFGLGLLFLTVVTVNLLTGP